MAALSIALVLSLELAHSALEYLLHHLHPDRAPEIGAAKDAAAAAVLVAALAAVSVGALMPAATLGRERPALECRRWNDSPALLAFPSGAMGTARNFSRRNVDA